MYLRFLPMRICSNSIPTRLHGMSNGNQTLKTRAQVTGICWVLM